MEMMIRPLASSRRRSRAAPGCGRGRARASRGGRRDRSGRGRVARPGSERRASSHRPCHRIPASRFDTPRLKVPGDHVAALLCQPACEMTQSAPDLEDVPPVQAVLRNVLARQQVPGRIPFLVPDVVSLFDTRHDRTSTSADGTRQGVRRSGYGYPYGGYPAALVASARCPTAPATSIPGSSSSSSASRSSWSSSTRRS